MGSVSFSVGGSCDRNIIFTDRTYLVFCFLGCVVKFQARKVNNWRKSASSNPCNWVCVLFLFLSFFSFLLLAFFLRSNTHTRKNKGVDFQKSPFVRFNMARDEELAKELVRSTCSKSNKGGASKDAERPKRDRYIWQFFSLDLWITD